MGKVTADIFNEINQNLVSNYNAMINDSKKQIDELKNISNILSNNKNNPNNTIGNINIKAILKHNSNIFKELKTHLGVFGDKINNIGNNDTEHSLDDNITQNNKKILSLISKINIQNESFQFWLKDSFPDLISDLISNKNKPIDNIQSNIFKNKESELMELIQNQISTNKKSKGLFSGFSSLFGGFVSGLGTIFGGLLGKFPKMIFKFLGSASGVILAGLAGWEIGKLIYDYYQKQIDGFVFDITGLDNQTKMLNIKIKLQSQAYDEEINARKKHSKELLDDVIDKETGVVNIEKLAKSSENVMNQNFKNIASVYKTILSQTSDYDMLSPNDIVGANVVKELQQITEMFSTMQGDKRDDAIKQFLQLQKNKLGKDDDEGIKQYEVLVSQFELLKEYEKKTNLKLDIARKYNIEKEYKQLIALQEGKSNRSKELFKLEQKKDKTKDDDIKIQSIKKLQTLEQNILSNIAKKTEISSEDFQKLTSSDSKLTMDLITKQLLKLGKKQEGLILGDKFNLSDMATLGEMGGEISDEFKKYLEQQFGVYKESTKGFVNSFISDINRIKIASSELTSNNNNMNLNNNNVMSDIASTIQKNNKTQLDMDKKLNNTLSDLLNAIKELSKNSGNGNTGNNMVQLINQVIGSNNQKNTMTSTLRQSKENVYNKQFQ